MPEKLSVNRNPQLMRCLAHLVAVALSLTLGPLFCFALYDLLAMEQSFTSTCAYFSENWHGYLVLYWDIALASFFPAIAIILAGKGRFHWPLLLYCLLAILALYWVGFVRGLGGF